MRSGSNWQKAFSIGSGFFFVATLLAALVFFIIVGSVVIEVFLMPLLLALIFGGLLGMVIARLPDNVWGLVASIVSGVLFGLTNLVVANALSILIFMVAPGIFFGEVYLPLWGELLSGLYRLAGVETVYVLIVPLVAISSWLTWKSLHRGA